MTAFAMQDAWKLLPVLALPVQDKPLRVFRVEGRGKCLAYGALSRVPAVIGIEGAEGVSAG